MSLGSYSGGSGQQKNTDKGVKKKMSCSKPILKCPRRSFNWVIGRPVVSHICVNVTNKNHALPQESTQYFMIFIIENKADKCVEECSDSL